MPPSRPCGLRKHRVFLRMAVRAMLWEIGFYYRGFQDEGKHLTLVWKQLWQLLRAVTVEVRFGSEGSGSSRFVRRCSFGRWPALSCWTPGKGSAVEQPCSAKPERILMGQINVTFCLPNSSLFLQLLLFADGLWNSKAVASSRGGKNILLVTVHLQKCSSSSYKQYVCYEDCHAWV